MIQQEVTEQNGRASGLMKWSSIFFIKLPRNGIAVYSDCIFLFSVFLMLWHLRLCSWRDSCSQPLRLVFPRAKDSPVSMLLIYKPTNSEPTPPYMDSYMDLYMMSYNTSFVKHSLSKLMNQKKLIGRSLGVNRNKPNN